MDVLTVLALHIGPTLFGLAMMFLFFRALRQHGKARADAIIAYGQAKSWQSFSRAQANRIVKLEREIEARSE